MKIKLLLFPLFIVLILFNSCKKADTSTLEGINGSWTLVSWIEDGVADPDVAQYEIALDFTNVANGTGTMTFNSLVVPFNYTGNFALDTNNILTATLDETTGNMEINQWILSMNLILGSNDLRLDGSMLKKSPFWPDTTTTVVFEASR